MSTVLRALVVYESMFGNTERLAQGVAKGLRLEDAEVTVTEVGEAPSTLSDVDLLVVGAPTHAFSLSRPSTRAEAVQKGAPESRQRLGLREWLGAGVSESPGLNIAVFDTRIDKVRRLPKAAGPRAAKIARRRGFSLLAKPAAFVVEDVKGPLANHEVERAVGWGQRVGDLARLRVAAAKVQAGVRNA
jgi:hypothetical protein